MIRRITGIIIGVLAFFLVFGSVVMQQDVVADSSALQAVISGSEYSEKIGERL